MVKYLTVKDKPPTSQNSSSSFSQQTISEESMIHSLHEGQDWWSKIIKKNTILLICKIQCSRSVSDSDDDTVEASFASGRDTSLRLTCTNGFK